MSRVHTVEEVRARLGIRRGGSIGFMPTMGALHEGHAALFRAARRASAHVVASIFVNPGQFTDPADLAAYPRQEDRDVEIAREAGVDTIFVPTVEEIYPEGDATSLVVRGAADGFESTFRPGHFDSVATVCAKLFNIVSPDVAYFGQKDAQQLAVIRQVVRDLRLNLRVEVVATVREADGLALSSRNVRLSTAERQLSLAIPRALEAGLAAYRDGADPASAAAASLAAAGFRQRARTPDPASRTPDAGPRTPDPGPRIPDPGPRTPDPGPRTPELTLDYADVAVFDGEPTLVIAARVGATRLIDNVPLDDPARAGLPIVRRSS